MKKKLVALLMTTAMVLSLFAGCNKPADKPNDDPKQTEGDKPADDDKEPAGEVIELTMWQLSSRQENFEKVVDEFNKSQDKIKVTVEYHSTDGMKDACKVGAQAGTLPDMWFNWGGSLGGYYPENGCTYDLTDYAAENGWADKFQPGVLTLCTLEDQLCGYPTAYKVLGMYYRVDIFEKYGLEEPTTMEEFDQICATLKENGITPISTGGLYGWHPMRLLEQFVEYYAGAELHDKLNTFDESWDNEAVVKALTKFQEYCDKGYFPDGFITADPNDTLMAVATGECAMDIQGQWYDTNINNDELDMDLFHWFPVPNDTDRMSAFAEMTQLNANLTDEELEAAITFLDATQCQANVDAGLIDSIPTLDCVIPESTPHVPEMLKNSEKGTFTITDQAFPTAVADVLFGVQDALYNGTTTPEQGAKDIQAAIEEHVK